MNRVLGRNKSYTRTLPPIKIKNKCNKITVLTLTKKT